MDISSPITSDEEYLSPLEEAMDYVGSSYRGPEPRKTIDTRFKEPPAFQVNCHISFGQLNNTRLNQKPVFVSWWDSIKYFYFQVTVGDQTVIEGQEVIMSVRVTGQPKPMLYW